MALKDTTKAEQDMYRKLSDIEQDIMYLVYVRNSGNHSLMAKDPDSVTKANSIIGYWARLYDWNEKFLKEKQERIEKEKKMLEETLLEGKLSAIKQAVVLLQVREEKAISLLNGKSFTRTVYPSNKDLKVAYEIIKTELGEPSTIRENKNKNELSEDSKEAIDFIEKMINGTNQKQQKNTRVDSEDVQDGRQTSGDSAEIPPSI